MKIGDVSPFPVDADIRLALAKQRGRGHLDRLAAGKGTNQLSHSARRVVGERDKALKRETDLFERAKTYLRRKGYVVFRADIRVAGAPGYIVGRRVADSQNAVIKIAERLGWKP